MLEFNPDTHEYKYDGKVVLSVTQVLGEWILVNGYYVNTYNPKIVIAESVMRQAADHGTAVHQGVNIILTDNLDWKALDHSLLNPLRQFEAWKAEYNPELVSTGYKMYSRRLKYSGTPDPFYVIKIGRRHVLCFVEIKTGAHMLAGPQLAAYVQLYREFSRFKGEVQRWVLELPREGKYSFLKCQNRYDGQFFESCLFRNSFIGQVQNGL